MTCKDNYTVSAWGEVCSLTIIIIHSTKQWRDIPPNLDGDIRDHATLQQLIILSNMESLNAVIKQGVSRSERRVKLSRIAKEQMSCLLKWDGTNLLEDYNHIGR